MKKTIALLLLLSILVSCYDQSDKTELQTELQTSPSTSINLIYPSGSGYSGDSINGLLGYGYDATGFCDTISVRAKIFDSLPDYSFGYPSTTFPTLINGSSFEDLINNIDSRYTEESGVALTQHLESLMRLAFKSDSIDSGYAYTYYSISYYNSVRGMFIIESEYQKYLSTNFKNDVVSLSPKELISKYGTHVLTDVFSGTKFEVLYRCKFGYQNSGSDCEQLFYNRMKEYIGGTFGIITDYSTNTKLSQTNEQFIYNSIGSSKKLCGVINATDYNPDSIRLNIQQIFNNLKTQFISIGKDGILPIYELISDETKKQEVKTYIEKYMSAKTVYK